MRSKQNWWLAAIIIVLGVQCCLAQGQVAIEPPDARIQVNWPCNFRVTGLAAEDLTRVTVRGVPESCSVELESRESGLWIEFEAAESGAHALIMAIGTHGRPTVIAVAIDVGGDRPGPQPPSPPPLPPADNVTAERVKAWLETVPADVRSEVIEDPVTGDKYTRQNAVGRTLTENGKVAKDLGSIKATNVMLATGLAAAFGPEIQAWKSFADSLDEALFKAEQKKVTPTEYGKILLLIGGALL